MTEHSVIIVTDELKDPAFDLENRLDAQAELGWELVTHAIRQSDLSPDSHYLTFKRERIN